MAPTPVVVGLDLDTAMAAVDWAAAEARRRHRPLLLLAAADAPLVDLWTAERAVVLDEAVTQYTHDHVARVTERLHTVYPDLAVTSEILPRPAAAALVDSSATADLLVVGTHSRGRFARFFVGSVSSKVVAHASCPVVVVPGGGEQSADRGRAPELPPSRVVVGVAPSAVAQHVLAFGFDFADRHGLPLLAVMAARPDLLTTPEGVYATMLHDDMAPWLGEALAGWREKYPDVTITEDVVVDHVAPVLTDRAGPADLLVIGKHSRPAALDAVLGSVSQGVLHHARGPVAVVPG